MVRSPSRIWWASALFALALAGCYEDGEDQIISDRDSAVAPDMAGCTAGERRPCDITDTCGGSQVCLGDGTYGPCVAPDEICDGADNDCDGVADEEFPTVGDACADGEGACRDEGMVVCTPDGSGTMCDAQPGDDTAEVCDNVDNDCDGTTDEDVEVGVACETNLPGVCSAGESACTDGDTVCEPTTEASDEICDGLDNDCDTNTDEGENGGALAESCYEDAEGNPGPEGTMGVGACVAGVRMCADGMFGGCMDAVLPMAEVCDGVDNDCDGTVDNIADGDCLCEPGTTEDCYDGPDGTDGVGVCQGGVRTCNDTGTGYGECMGQRLPGVEICNDLDDDCNGESDDVSGVGEACMEGQGECMAEGVRVCDLESGAVVCNAQPDVPGDEICDGLDNDCDGAIDDVEGAGEPCDAGVGACLAGGVFICDPKGGEGLVCNAVEGDPAAEICDGVDNDCNGAIDDVDGVGEDCEVGVGACRSTGVTTCDPDGGGVICPATAQDPAPAEYCDNGVDDDCDGETDEADCIIPCEVDDDCRGPGETCVDGACVFTACETDDDCAPEQQCIDMVCVDDEICDDGVDNDGDGDLDCADAECAEDPACFQDTGCGVAQVVGFGTYQAELGGDSVIATAPCALPPDTTGPEAVFVFTPDAAGEICVDTLGSTADTVLTVRGEPCEADGSVIACNDDAGGDFETGSQVGFTAMAGSTYYFVADTFEGSAGTVTLTVTDGPCAPVPGVEICDNGGDDDDDGLVDCLDEDCAGDPTCQDPTLCDEAMPLDLGRTEGMAMGPSRTSTASCTFPINGADGPEMVYGFTPEGGGTYCVDTRGSMIDTVLTVRGEPCEDPANEIACNDDVGMGVDASSEVEVELMDGTTYYVVVDTFAGGGGPFVVNVREGSCEDPPVEICDDGFDNDGNGDVDCDDIACALDPACPVLGDENCGDGVDNDGDGDVDCADADCALSPLCVEDCNNGVDDDADGDIDCDDADCFLNPICFLGPREICGNGEDDDDDGLTDCDDADCIDDPFCQQDYACEDAIPIGFGTVDGTLDGESRTSLASCGFPPNTAAGPDATYVFTPAADGEFCVATDTVGLFPVDTILTVRVDPCNDPASEVACSDDANILFDTDSEATVAGTAGTAYYIVVDTNEGDGGDFTLTVTPGNCDDPQPFEDCDNGEDDDGDGDVDCDDADCAADPICDVQPGTCGDPFVIDGPGVYEGDTTGAPSQNVETAEDCVTVGVLGAASSEHVYAFTPDADGTYCFSTGGTAHDTVLYAREAACEDPEAEVACNDDNRDVAGGTQSAFDLATTGGATYYVFVDGWNANNDGPYTLTVTEGPCIDPEICDDGEDNDLDGDVDCDDADCLDDPACDDVARTCDAPRLLGFETRTVILEGGSTVDTASCTVPPNGADGPDAAFVLDVDVGEEGRTVCVDTLGSTVDTVLTAYLELCGVAEVACDDDSGVAGTSQVEVFLPFDNPGYVIVDSFAGASGEATVTVTDGPCEPIGPPEICDDGVDNDDDGLVDCADPECADDPLCNDPLACDGAPEIGFGTERGTLEGESATSQASCALPRDGATGPEAIYAFVPDAPGTVCVDTFGSAADTILTVRTDDCVGAGSELACSDDADGFASEAEFDAEAGSTYYIVVDSYPGDAGDFAVRVRPGSCDVPIPDELCVGGLDEDLDGLVDCDDPDCQGTVACEDPADLCTYDFEGDAFDPAFETDGDAPWTIGGGVATSGAIADDQTSTLRLAVSTPTGGSVAFRYRVSSEAPGFTGTLYDYLEFTVDGVPVLQEAGEVDFTDFEIALLPGDHVLEWTYIKDGSLSGGEDLAQIDDVVISGAEGLCAPVEICDNGGDDDDDGDVDCDDVDCAADPVCLPATCTFDFEGGDFDPAFETDGDAPWSIIDGVATSGDIADNQRSNLRLAVSTPLGGTVSFRYRTSVEQPDGPDIGDFYDYLQFTVDGEIVGAWAGETPFSDFEVALAPGDHVLEWSYIKDGSLSGGEDRVQVDDVVIEGAVGLCAPGDDPEICDDGIDNDGDGDTDCADADCADEPACEIFDCSYGFQSDDFDPVFETDGDAPWFIEGGLATSGDIADNQRSNLRLAVSTPLGGTVSFRYRTSVEVPDGPAIEDFYDYLQFTVDGEVAGAWAGETPFSDFEVELAPGDHVLEWSYIKDGSLSGGEDRAQIDDLSITGAAGLCPPVEGDLRLVDGEDAQSGRLEVFHAGEWGTVCDDVWEEGFPNTTAPQGFINGDVACRQLGFVGAEGTYNAPPGVDPIWMDGVTCVGDEGRLIDCPFNGFGDEDCGHGEDIGLRCLAPGECRIDAHCIDGQICVEGACADGVREICDNGVDDNGDGDVDCADAECDGDPFCAPLTCENARSIGFETQTVLLRGEGNYNAASCTFPPDGADGPDAVFVFTPPGVDPVTICVDTLGSTVDTVLTVAIEPCESGEQACDDDSGPSGTSQLEFIAPGEVGTYLFVDTFAGESGEATITVTEGPCEPIGPPEICDDDADNDDDGLIDCADPECADDPLCNDPLACDGAAEIGFGTERGTLEGESATSQASCALPRDGATGPEAIYAFVADAPGAVCVDTFGSAADTILTVRTDDCVGAGSELACSDDADGFASEVEFAAEAGSTYYIVVDSYPGDAGDFAVRVRPGGCDVPIPDELCVGGLDEDLDGLVDCDDPDCDGNIACADPADLCTYDFEGDAFDPVFETDGDAPWTIGGGVATSGDIGDSQSSTLRLAVSTPTGGAVSFRYRVSSEGVFLGAPTDFLTFSVDGVVVLTDFDNPDFTDFEVALLPGDHVLEWTYQKDGSVSEGEDRAQIDDLVISGAEGLCDPAPVENCDNGADDDDDGDVDCADDDCIGDPVCVPGVELVCDDDIDDDGDGDTDCADPDCAADPVCELPQPDGTVYFVVNDGFGIASELHVRNGDGDAAIVGPITVEGQPAPIEAIALTPDGTLYGFMVLADTTVITIDPATAEGTPVLADGDPVVIDDFVFGAGAAPDGTVYVLLGFEQVIAPLTDGVALGAPVANLPTFFQFGDIAFDPNGGCYLAGVDIAGDPTGLYTCDLDAGTFDLLGGASQGFDEEAAPIGLAVAGGLDPCLGSLYGFDVRGEDEYGVYDLAADPPQLTRLGLVGDNFAPPDFGDAAGWYTQPDLPECEVVVEICDNEIDDDGNGDTDCADAACALDPACPPVAEICDNVIDDDLDGDADCDDADCAGDPACPPPLDGDLIITEIMVNPAGSDTGTEWFELYNGTGEAIDLTGWTLRDDDADSEVLGALVIESGAYAVLADGANPGFEPDYVMEMILSQGATGDEVVLVDLDGVERAAVRYDDGDLWPFGNGAAMQFDDRLDADAAANADPANWCQATQRYRDNGAGDFGTPGEPNDPCGPVGEPIDFCRLQFPLELEGIEGDTFTVYGRFYEEGVTDLSNLNDVAPGVAAELGYLPDGADPADPASWTWIEAIPNPGYVANDEPNNDEYQADMVLPAEGLYSYAFRFTVDDGEGWTLCDGDGSGANLDGGDGTSFSLDEAGIMLSEAPSACREGCQDAYDCGFGAFAPGVDVDDCTTQCEGGALTPEQAQCIADGLEPPAQCDPAVVFACTAGP